jgi:hypothetical protein
MFDLLNESEKWNAAFRQLKLTLKQLKLVTWMFVWYSVHSSKQHFNSTFHRTLKRLCAQVGYAMAFQVLCSGEWFPTAFHWAGESPVIIMFPARKKHKGVVITHTTHRQKASEVFLCLKFCKIYKTTSSFHLKTDQCTFQKIFIFNPHEVDNLEILLQWLSWPHSQTQNN